MGVRDCVEYGDEFGGGDSTQTRRLLAALIEALAPNTHDSVAGFFKGIVGYSGALSSGLNVGASNRDAIANFLNGIFLVMASASYMWRKRCID